MVVRVELVGCECGHMRMLGRGVRPTLAREWARAVASERRAGCATAHKLVWDALCDPCACMASSAGYPSCVGAVCKRDQNVHAISSVVCQSVRCKLCQFVCVMR